jgi:hypothetical protein
MTLEYKYIIVGGGLSGLMTAYLLNKIEKNEKILLLEKENHLGGQLEDNYRKNEFYIEHSPRVILNDYNNFLKYVPIDMKKLSKPLENKIIKNDKIINTNELFDVKDYIYLFYYFIYNFFSCNERMDNIKLYDIINDDTEVLSNILGETKNMIPYYKFYRIMENLLNNGDPKTYTMKGPFNETIIKEIIKKLDDNVIIQPNSEVIDIDEKENILKLSNNKKYNYNKLIIAYNFDNKEEKQLSIQLNFNKKIRLPPKIKSMFSIDDNIKLIIAPYELIWDNEYKIYNSLWSINITDLKNIKDISDEELIKKIINILNKNLNINIINDDFTYNVQKINYYPNRIGDLKNRIKPGKIKKDIYICGSHTKTTYYSTYMESSVESVIRMINELLNKNLWVYNHNTTYNIFKILDKYFYKLFPFFKINLIGLIVVLLSIYYLIFRY